MNEALHTTNDDSLVLDWDLLPDFLKMFEDDPSIKNSMEQLLKKYKDYSEQITFANNEKKAKLAREMREVMDYYKKTVEKNFKFYAIKVIAINVLDNLRLDLEKNLKKIKTLEQPSQDSPFSDRAKEVSMPFQKKISADSIVLGQGINTVSESLCERALNVISIHSQEINQHQVTYFVCRSTRKLKEKLKASLSGKENPAKLFEQFDLSAIVKKSHFELYVVIFTYIIKRIDMLNSNTGLKETVKTLLSIMSSMDESKKDFAENYGDVYINKIFYGRNKLVVFQLHLETRQQQQNLKDLLKNKENLRHDLTSLPHTIHVYSRGMNMPTVIKDPSEYLLSSLTGEASTKETLETNHAVLHWTHQPYDAQVIIASSNQPAIPSRTEVAAPQVASLDLGNFAMLLKNFITFSEWLKSTGKNTTAAEKGKTDLPVGTIAEVPSSPPQVDFLLIDIMQGFYRTTNDARVQNERISTLLEYVSAHLDSFEFLNVKNDAEVQPDIDVRTPCNIDKSLSLVKSKDREAIPTSIKIFLLPQLKKCQRKLLDTREFLAKNITDITVILKTKEDIDLLIENHLEPLDKLIHQIFMAEGDLFLLVKEIHSDKSITKKYTGIEDEFHLSLPDKADQLMFRIDVEDNNNLGLKLKKHTLYRSGRRTKVKSTVIAKNITSETVIPITEDMSYLYLEARRRRANQAFYVDIYAHCTLFRPKQKLPEKTFRQDSLKQTRVTHTAVSTSLIDPTPKSRETEGQGEMIPIAPTMISSGIISPDKKNPIEPSDLVEKQREKQENVTSAHNSNQDADSTSLRSIAIPQFIDEQTEKTSHPEEKIIKSAVPVLTNLSKKEGERKLESSTSMEQLFEQFHKSISFLGLGHHSVVHKVALNSAIKPYGIVEMIIEGMNTSVAILNTLDDLKTRVDEALSISHENLSVPAMAISSVKSYFENTHKETHAYIVITVAINSKSLSYKNAILEKNALALLDGSDDDLKSFYAKYGDGFVQRITYGNKVVFVLRTDKSKAESLEKLETELGVKISRLGIGDELSLLGQKLNSVKTEDRLFIPIGNSNFFETITETSKLDEKKADDLENNADFAKKIAAYFKSDSPEIIYYGIKPYSSVENVNKKAAEKLSNLVSDELGFFLLRLNVCLKKIGETKILDPNNIVGQNTYPEKTRDVYYELYEALKKQLQIFHEELLRFSAKYNKSKTTLTQDEKTELEKLLSQTEEFLAKNEQSLKKALSLTLIRKVVLPKGSAKTKGFKLDFSDDLKLTTRLLFVQTDDNSAEQIQVLMQKNKLSPLFTCPTEKSFVSAKGCYFPANIGRNALGVKLITPDKLDHDIVIKIYAATEATLLEYDITSLNERGRKVRPLDEAVGEDFVMDEAEARKKGYLDYNKEDKSDAALSSEVGFDYHEDEEFELETLEDNRPELLLSQ